MKNYSPPAKHYDLIPSDIENYEIILSRDQGAFWIGKFSTILIKNFCKKMPSYEKK